MTDYAIIIRTTEELKEDGKWMITTGLDKAAPDLPGVLLWGEDLDKLRADVPNAIKMIFKLNHKLHRLDVIELTESLPIAEDG